MWTEFKRIEWGPVRAFCENCNKSCTAIRERRFSNQVVSWRDFSQ